MRFPLSTGMAKNGNFIPVTERNRAIIPGPKGNDGNKGGEYFPRRAVKLICSFHINGHLY